MKCVFAMAVVALFVVTPILVWSAEDGAALYDAKCSMCHGDKGEGNPPGGIPKVAGTSMTVDQLVTYLTKGDSSKTVHKEPISDLTADQAKAVSEYIRKMK